ncbi:MAG: hypothetical protein QOE05_3090 [Actinomycetota bacterium]|jgi:hypothetical protein|nr:hypothetical protein [Actinomycetota bacterium]
MSEQTVIIECATCQARWSAPIADIPEGAVLSEIAYEFLAKHKDCADGVNIEIASQRQ